MMKTSWKFQDARNQFSKVVENALESGPQYVTRRGVETVVIIMYHGKKKGIETPSSSSKDICILRHPYFGMNAGDTEKSVECTVDVLRNVRY